MEILKLSRRGLLYLETVSDLFEKQFPDWIGNSFGELGRIVILSYCFMFGYS